MLLKVQRSPTVGSPGVAPKVELPEVGLLKMRQQLMQQRVQVGSGIEIIHFQRQVGCLAQMDAVRASRNQGTLSP